MITAIVILVIAAAALALVTWPDKRALRQELFGDEAKRTQALPLDEFTLAAMREVDALTPQVPPMAPKVVELKNEPPRPAHVQRQADDRGWYRYVVIEHLPAIDSFRLMPGLGGHVVTREWLEYHRDDLQHAAANLTCEALAKAGSH